jgi:hypothetical protein
VSVGDRPQQAFRFCLSVELEPPVVKQSAV